MDKVDDETSLVNQGSPREPRSIPLVVYNEEKGTYDVCPEALEFLQTIPGPIGVISVAGMYRTGKSFLLNRVLLDRKAGFTVGPTINPCTKGLWLWGEAIPGKTPEGEPVYILVIDSEGLGALDQDANHDCKIFSLAILLASLFIYNSVGSIDESALQNLSLVVNLTEHIHIKSQQEEVGCEDYAAYFPSFLWVVRDFILQLVSQEGETMTAKEYLEKSLMPQKGFSDAAEEKNRIRRLLKNFFKDRDCCTLVRPITEEDGLQSLAEKELHELRPEFVEQMTEVREKSMLRIKKKMLNGKEIDGNMLSNLVNIYVQSINEGTVPNIENAWSYICKNECQKAYVDSMTIYDQTLVSGVQESFPIDPAMLAELIKSARAQALDHFRAKSLGSDTDEVLAKLKQAMTEKGEALCLENEEECDTNAKAFLDESFQGLERRLRDGEITVFSEFEKNMRNFEEFFIEHGPPGRNRSEILLQFVYQKTLDASDYFIKNLSNEVNLQKQISDQHISKLENDMMALKEDTLKEKDNLQRALTNTESEKSEMKAKETSLQMQLDSVKEQMCKTESQYQADISELKSDFKVRLADAGSRSSDHEDVVKDYDRKLGQVMAEFDQEKALLSQQIEFQKRTIEDAEKRSIESTSELNEGQKKHSDALKELHERYEVQISSLRERLDNAQESILTVEKDASEKESSQEREKALWQQAQLQLQSKNDNLAQKLTEANAQISASDEKCKQRIDELIIGHESNTRKLRARLEETEKRLRQTEENLNSDRIAWEKDNAIMIQKVEFLETQLEENGEQLVESKRQLDKMVKAMQDVNSDESMREELESQLDHIKETHQKELHALENQYETDLKDLRAENETLHQTKNDQELKSRMDTGDLSHMNQQLTERSTSLETELLEARAKIELYENESMSMKESIEAKLQARAREMESRIKQIESSSQEEIDSINAKAEQSLHELKEYYEKEKARVESRLTEEKDKSAKRYTLMCEEYEARLREERENYEDDIATLHEEMNTQSTASSNDFISLREQKSLDSQKIQTLEQYLQETKESLNTIHISHTNSMETQLESFNKERRSLLDKVEKLAQDSANKDRELTAGLYQREQLQTTISSKTKEFEDLKAEITRDREALLERLDDAKNKNQTIADEFIQKKNDYKREIALTTQHIEFQANKITDLESSLAQANKRYNEKLKSFKDETGFEYSDMIEKLTAEKTTLEAKLDAKRTEYKDLTLERRKQINDLERENARLTEKLSALEGLAEERESLHKNEMAKLNEQLNTLREQENTGKMSLYLENERLKTLTQELEKEVNERNSAYERDRTLWENKFNFLAQQRDQSRHELADAQRKFEQTLDQLQKRGSFEKDKLESTTSSLISSVETRYLNQIKELQEQHQTGISEIIERNKHLETEARLLKEELQLERRSKASDSGTLSQQLENAKENESTLKSQIAVLKTERDRRHGEISTEKDKENESLRGTISNLEKRTKEAENYRGQLFLEHEKERAKWALERDHLISQKNDAQDMIERLEKRKEALLRENEKYRTERGPRSRVVSMLRKDAGVPKPVSNMANILGSSMSFEEFNKERFNGGILGGTASNTPRSNESRDQGRSSKSPTPRTQMQNGIKKYSPHIRELSERNIHSTRYAE